MEFRDPKGVMQRLKQRLPSQELKLGRVLEKKGEKEAKLAGEQILA